MVDIRRRDLLAPLTGILAPVLWALSYLVQRATSTPRADASARDVAAYLDRGIAPILLSSLLFTLGTLAFLWFATSLRSHEAMHEGGPAHGSSLMQAAAIASVPLLLGMMAPLIGGALAARAGVDIAPAAAHAIGLLSSGLLVMATWSLALFLLATGLVALRTRVLPAWLSWSAFVLAALMVIMPFVAPIAGMALMAVLFSLWLVAAGLTLWRHEVGEARTGAPTTATAM